MKKLLIAVLCLISIFALGTSYIFFKTSGMVSSADSFFTSIRDGDTERAASYASEAFKAATSPDEFALFSQQSILKDFKEASWTTRSIAGDTGRLEGAITTTDGGSLPIMLSMINEGGAWRIYSIQTPTAGLVSEGGKYAPTNDRGVALVRESIREFGMAVAQRDFASFYAYISTLWRDQVTPEELAAAFKPFIEQEIDLSVLTKMSPVFDQQPKIDENGILHVSGHYPTKPSTLKFEFGYIKEGMKWKLMKAAIDISPNSQP